MRLQRFILATTTATAVFVAPSAVRAQVVTATGGEVSMLTQKNVVDRLIVGDSVEVELAMLAAGKTTNAAVRELANLLVTDHRAHLDSLRVLAATPDIGRFAVANDSTAPQDARKLAQLRALPADSTFDRAFVTDMVDRHQRSIENLKKWRGSATSPAVQADIGRALAIAEQHLARALAIAQAK